MSIKNKNEKKFFGRMKCPFYEKLINLGHKISNKLLLTRQYVLNFQSFDCACI